MPTTYSTPAGNARLTACLITTSTSVGVSVDGQSGFGALVLGTSALSGATGVLATITLQKPSFSIATKVATTLGTPISVSPSANGTAALAELRDGGGNTVASGLTVGLTGSGADVIVGSTALVTSVPVQLISGTVTTI